MEDNWRKVARTGPLSIQSRLKCETTKVVALQAPVSSDFRFSRATIFF